MRFRSLIEGEISERMLTPSFAEEYDVIVIGLGTAGSMAAITAGELGMRTLGIERLNGMGGTGTMGSVLDYYYGQGGGRLEAVNRRCEQRMKSGHYVTSQRAELTGQGRISFPGMVKSLVLEECALENGVEISYNSVLAGVYLEGNAVRGIRVWKENRFWDYGARILIDASGEAEAAYLAGCPMQEGRLSDHKCGCVSKSWTLRREDYEMGLWRMNGRADANRAKDYNRANLQAMAQIVPLVGSAQVPVSRAVYESPMLCVREGRRPYGTETLLLKDYLEGRTTAEPVFYAASHVDSASSDMAMEDELMQDYEFISDLRPIRVTVPVPMGALIAKDAEGVLLAGRCMAVDHNLSGCLRMKMDMEKTGEAAAVIAWAAKTGGTGVRNVSYERVERELRKSGCLADEQNQPWREDFWHGDAALIWPEKARDLPELFRKEATARTAIWYARNHMEECREELIKGLRSEEEPVRRCSALALGMDTAPEARETLRKMAVSDKKTDANRAACLLGRYEKAEDAEIMLRILRQPPDGTADSAYLFQQAEMALLRIARANTGCEGYLEELRGIVFHPDFCAYVDSIHLDLTETIRRMALDA